MRRLPEQPVNDIAQAKWEAFHPFSDWVRVFNEYSGKHLGRCSVRCCEWMLGYRSLIHDDSNRKEIRSEVEGSFAVRIHLFR